MQRHQNRNAPLLLGLAFTSVFALGGWASAQDATKVGPGFGYTIDFMKDFMSSGAAEALQPEIKPEVTEVRPGFGYTIRFMTGPNAEALLPVDWSNRKVISSK